MTETDILIVYEKTGFYREGFYMILRIANKKIQIKMNRLKIGSEYSVKYKISRS